MYLRTGLACILFIFLSGCGEETPEQKRDRLAGLQEERAKLEEKISSLEQELEEMEAPAAEPSRKKPVELRSLRKRAFSHYIEVQGEAFTRQNALLNPEATGVLQTIHFEEGDRVEKGQSIMQIDDETVRNNIAEVETNLDHARNIYQRQSNLWQKEIGSEVEYLRAKNEKDRLEKNLRSLETQLEQTKVKAPFTGYLDEIMIEEGEFATSSQPVARILNPDEIRIRARVSEHYRHRVAGLDSAGIKIPATGYETRAPVRHIGHLIDPGDRTFNVTVDMPDADHHLKPNMIAQLRLRDYHRDSVLTVPIEVVRHKEGQSFVFLAEEKDGEYVAVEKKIKTGKSQGGRTEVREGLNVGDQLIIRGHTNVNEGDKLNPESR